MAERRTAIFADQIDDLALGDGLKKQVADDTIMEVAYKSNDGLTIDTSELTIDYDDASIGIVSNQLAVKVDGIDDTHIRLNNDGWLNARNNADDDDINILKIDTSDKVSLDGTSWQSVIDEDKLDISNAPTDGYFLQWDSGAGKMKWADIDVEVIQDDDLIFNEIPSGSINSLNTTFTLANTPVVGKQMIFLNGLLQAPGGGLDYTMSGSTITFTKAPHTNSDLYAFYLIS